MTGVCVKFTETDQPTRTSSLKVCRSWPLLEATALFLPSPLPFLEDSDSCRMGCQPADSSRDEDGSCTKALFGQSCSFLRAVQFAAAVAATAAGLPAPCHSKLPSTGIQTLQGCEPVMKCRASSDSRSNICWGSLFSPDL